MTILKTTYEEMDRLVEWAAADIRGRLGRFIADQEADAKDAGSREER